MEDEKLRGPVLIARILVILCMIMAGGVIADTFMDNDSETEIVTQGQIIETMSFPILGVPVEEFHLITNGGGYKVSKEFLKLNQEGDSVLITKTKLFSLPDKIQHKISETTFSFGHESNDAFMVAPFLVLFLGFGTLLNIRNYVNAIALSVLCIGASFYIFMMLITS
ncbi:MAG TPA: hypothetical protein PKH65_08810 [Bacteroidia bacterium]|nr:hypothetical protein [Bacteroidia bacterium]